MANKAENEEPRQAIRLSMLVWEKEWTWQFFCTTVVFNVFPFNFPWRPTVHSLCLWRVHTPNQSNMESCPSPTLCMTYRSLLVTYFPYIAGSWWAQPPSHVTLLWGVSFHGLQLWAVSDTLLCNTFKIQTLNKEGKVTLTVDFVRS